MDSRTTSEKVAIAGGIALVLFGGLMLLGDAGHIFAWTFGPFLRTVASIVWPVTLVVAGVYLLTRPRSAERGVAPVSCAATAAPTASSGRGLRRSRTDRVVTGLMGGIGEFLGMPAGIVRAIFILLTLTTGVLWGIAVYVLGSILVPDVVPAAATAGPCDAQSVR